MIRIIKFYAWELIFLKNINIARDNEKKTILHALVERTVPLHIIHFLFQNYYIDPTTINAVDEYGKTFLDYALDENIKNELQAIL